jgi:hypothetical protein
MHFRNTLLGFSLLIIGLCLTLYFQADQSHQVVNWDQYTQLSYNEERSHSLKELNQKLLPFDLVTIIQEVHDRNRLLGEKTRVMEIGTGNGRVLMELKRRFPEVEFYGINKEKTHTFYRRESFILTGLKLSSLTARSSSASSSRTSSSPTSTSVRRSPTIRTSST